MNKKTLRIAEELVKTAEDLIFADSDYIYDPDHKKHPGGGYHKTEKGWSKKEEKKEKSTSSPKVEMTDEQKKLDEMAKSGNYGIRENVAKNPNTSVKTLDKLSNDEYYAVRENVAKNKNTSVKTLDKLSNDEDYEIRENVATHPNTSPKTLDKLSNDEVKYVRRNVAEHPNTSPETLKKLSNDKSDEIRTIAKEKLSQKVLDNSGFDFSKLSPELREKVKDWDIEDIKKFLGWLKKQKG